MNAQYLETIESISFLSSVLSQCYLMYKTKTAALFLLPIILLGIGLLARIVQKVISYRSEQNIETRQKLSKEIFFEIIILGGVTLMGLLIKKHRLNLKIEIKGKTEKSEIDRSNPSTPTAESKRITEKSNTNLRVLP